MSWAFAQFRPHVALRGRLCAVWDILARGVANARLLSAFLSFFIAIPNITPHKPRQQNQSQNKICFRYDVLYTF
jgi:hypothetical protein